MERALRPSMALQGHAVSRDYLNNGISELKMWLTPVLAGWPAGCDGLEWQEKQFEPLLLLSTPWSYVSMVVLLSRLVPTWLLGCTDCPPAVHVAPVMM